MQSVRVWRRLEVIAWVCAQLGCAGTGPEAQISAPNTARATGQSTTATVINATHTTQCAEEDNVYVKLAGAGLTAMRIEARQPSYIAQLQRDDSAADFTDCHFASDENPVYHFEPKRVVLWEDERWVLVGNTYATFWRPNQVPVVVNGQITEQIHLLQLHLKDASEPSAGRHEFLVLYPPDGYWRAKPIPARPLPSSVYGTSFLVGPVTEAKRPVVNIARVELVPERLTFKLDFSDGSHGTMQLVDVNRDKVVLLYQQDRALPPSQPLAAIRSMFVTNEKSDVAEVSWRERSDAPVIVQPVIDFTQHQASEVRFGRTVISKHNPSAPDMWFGQFMLAPR